MTVDELAARITYAELVEWAAWFELEEEAHEKAMKKSASKSRR